MKELQYIDSLLDAVAELAIQSGVAPETLTINNAVKACIKIVKENQALTVTVKELGYSTLPRAVKALGQYKQGSGPTNIEHLPEVLHKIPAVWLSGKPKTKKEPGFAPLRVRDAERQHRVITPLLLEAWELADADTQDSIVREYLSESSAEFERNLYRYINDLEEVTFEEELERLIQPTDADVNDTLCRLLDPKYRYNVLPKDNEPPAPGV